MKVKNFILILIALSISLLSYAQLHEEEHIYKGLEYQKNNELDKALGEYEKALLINPNNEAALFNAGQMHLMEEAWEKAILKFQKIININPKDGESYYNLALAHYYMGDIAKAIHCNDKSQELGFQGTEEFRYLLKPFRQMLQHRELDLKYQPILDNNDKKIIIKIRGQITADALLLDDTIRIIEPLASVNKKYIFTTVDIKFIGIDQNTGKGIEEWTLLWADGSKKIFEVVYQISSIGGTDIEVSEKKH